MTCARGEPVSFELIQEAAADVWIRCHQVVVIAWSSSLRAWQCVCAVVGTTHQCRPLHENDQHSIAMVSQLTNRRALSNFSKSRKSPTVLKEGRDRASQSSGSTSRKRVFPRLRGRWTSTQESSMPEEDVPRFDWHVRRRGRRRFRKAWMEGVAGRCDRKTCSEESLENPGKIKSESTIFRRCGVSQCILLQNLTHVVIFRDAETL